MNESDTIGIERVDHVGIRVADADRALAFYALLGFEVFRRVEFDAVIIIRNKNDVEFNLVINAAGPLGDHNVLMDDAVKLAGFAHVALRVPSMKDTIDMLKQNDIAITQGPVIKIWQALSKSSRGLRGKSFSLSPYPSAHIKFTRISPCGKNAPLTPASSKPDIGPQSRPSARAANIK